MPRIEISTIDEVNAELSRIATTPALPTQMAQDYADLFQAVTACKERQPDGNYLLFHYGNREYCLVRHMFRISMAFAYPAVRTESLYGEWITRSSQDPDVLLESVAMDVYHNGGVHEPWERGRYND